MKILISGPWYAWVAMLVLICLYVAEHFFARRAMQRMYKLNEVYESHIQALAKNNTTLEEINMHQRVILTKLLHVMCRGKEE